MVPWTAVPPRPCSKPPWIDLYERFEQSDGPIERSSKVDNNDIKTKNKGCNLMIGSKCMISVLSNHPKIKSDIEFKIGRYKIKKTTATSKQ